MRAQVLAHCPDTCTSRSQLVSSAGRGKTATHFLFIGLRVQHLHPECEFTSVSSRTPPLHSIQQLRALSGPLVLYRFRKARARRAAGCFFISGGPLWGSRGGECERGRLGSSLEEGPLPKIVVKNFLLKNSHFKSWLLEDFREI